MPGLEQACYRVKLALPTTPAKNERILKQLRCGTCVTSPLRVHGANPGSAEVYARI